MNDISELRELLFQTMRQLNDNKDPMDVERARAMSDVAQTIINSAKVEVDYMKQTGAVSGSGFVKLDRPDSRANIRTVPRDPMPGLVGKLA